MSTVTEAELKASAVAPRVTLGGLEANIRASYCFNVLHVLEAVNETHPNAQTPLLPELGVLTFCVLVLQNGYTVTGQSACADPANYNPDIGNRLATEDAKKKIWSLMGYALKEEIHKNGDGSFFGRMQREARELEDRLNKAIAFIGSDTFDNLSSVERDLLISQKNAMAEYHEILTQRINAVIPA